MIRITLNAKMGLLTKMDQIPDKARRVIKEFNPKFSDSQIGRIYNISKSRNNIICKRHYVSKIEQSKQYNMYLMQEVSSFSDLVSRYPNLLKKKDQDLITLNPWDLATKEWHEPVEKKRNKELIEKAQMQHTVETDEKCPNCKVVGKSYCFDLKQMRSADEPMTQLWKCDNCGYRWNI